MEIILWGMAVLGINNIPSISSMKDISDDLQELYGIWTHCYEGALGHIYYANSLADQIAQVCIFKIKSGHCY